MTSTSFTFKVGAGGIEPEGSTITFSTYEQNGEVFLRQTAWWNNQNLKDFLWTNCSELVAQFQWERQAYNLASLSAWYHSPYFA